MFETKESYSNDTHIAHHFPRKVKEGGRSWKGVWAVVEKGKAVLIKEQQGKKVYFG